MKYAFDGLISRLGMAGERPSELEDIAMETFTETPNTEKRREQRPEKQNRLSKDHGTITKDVIHT